MKQVRVAVMGAGAVGGYFGARLAAAGHDVCFIARGKQLEAMRSLGLKIESIQGNLHIRSGFAPEPREAGPADLILFCVKSYDTEEAARALAPMVGKDTRILSLQNGVDNPDKIAALWEKERALAGVVYIASQIVTPGVIRHSAGGRIVLGEPEGGVSEATREVERLFSAAGVPCAVSREIRKVLWEKLVWNAPFCALACLARTTAQEIVESDSLRKLAVDCMEEVREAAKCQGVEVGASAVEEALKLSRNLGDFKPSMLQDLEAGKPLEHEAFNGVVVRLGGQAGKEMVINRIFYEALKFFDKRNRGKKNN